MKAYIRVKDKLGVEVDCRGYDFYCKWYENPHRAYDGLVFVSDDYRKEIFSYGKSTFVPQKGMSVYVQPKCPLAIADIRKNYVVKRKPEDADFILHHTEDRDWRSWNCYDHLIIIPEKKAVFAQYKYQNDGNLAKYVLEVFPDFNDMDLNLVFNMTGSFEFKHFDNNIIGPFVDRFEGLNAKPLVYYKDLPIEMENQLDTEVLEMLLKIGQKPYDSNGEENFKLQLQALNQTNWRDYPGTLGMLFNTLYYSKKRTCATEGFRRPSAFPKAVKELYKTMRSQPCFTTDKDRELARSFIERTCEFDAKKCHTIQHLASKFHDSNINMSFFYMLYDNLVKIRPHVSESEA